jgi:hypothetical protein
MAVPEFAPAQTIRASAENQDAALSPTAPDFVTQSRASARMTDCGPAPAGPSASTAIPSAASDPTQHPSGRRVKDICVPDGRSWRTSLRFGRALAACCCSSTSLATQAEQRVRWNFASRCARYLSTAKCWNSCSCPHALATIGRATMLPEGSAIALLSGVGLRRSLSLDSLSVRPSISLLTL